MRIGAMWAFCSAANYRALSPLQALARRGHDIYWGPAEGYSPFGKLADCDVVIVYRRFDPQTLQTVRRLKDAGVAIVWDNDDDYLNMPRVRKIRRESGGLNNRQMFAEVLRTARVAHLVTTPSERLARILREAGGLRDVRVIENYILDEPRPAHRGSATGLTVGWIAGMEHHRDALALRVPDTLRALQERHPHLEVTTVGVDLGLRERYRHAASVDFNRLPEVMQDFDIGIAPLVDTPYNRARSNIKVKEYAASQVPWLASPVEPYAALGEDEGGRLVPDDGWYDALDALISDAQERRRLTALGSTWAARQTMASHIGQYERWLADLVEEVSGKPAQMPMPTVALGMDETHAGMRERRLIARIPNRMLRKAAAR
jgi:glycosyltransferase involved in cell wall biosynthesis